MSKTYTKTFTKIGYRAWDKAKDCVLSEEDKEDVSDCYGDIQLEKFKYARRHWRGNFRLSADSEELIDKICRENEWPGATIYEYKHTLPVEIVEDTDEDGDPVYEAFGQKFDYLFDLVEAIDWRHSDVEPECKVVEEWTAAGRTFYRTFTKGVNRLKVKIVESVDEYGYPVYEAFGKKFECFGAIADVIDWERADVEPECKDVEEWTAKGRTFYRTFKEGGNRVKVGIVECKDESCHTFYEALGKKFDYIYDIADAIDWNDVEPEDKDVEGCN